MNYAFDCPLCGEQYWNDNSIVYDEGYDDQVCYHCKDELDAERRSQAHAEIGG